MAEKWVKVVIAIIKVLTYVYDIITFPIYAAIQQPWTTLRNSKRIKAKSITGKPEGPYVSIEKTLESSKKLEGLTTLCEVFECAVRRNQMRQCFGTREIISEDDEMQPNGKVFKKLFLGEYLWDSFDRVNFRVNNFAKALYSMGYSRGHNVVLFAETRADWLIACLGSLKSNVTVVTLYATLGDDALVHGINETESTLIITSYDLLPKFKVLLNKTPKVQQVIYMDSQVHSNKKASLDGFPNNVQFNTFKEIEQQGNDMPDAVQESLPTPTKDDIAIIMYTSGSTGLPKGVIISHNNLISALHGLSNVIEMREDDMYLGYLPLAHVLELLAELLCLLHGVPIGYSNAQTISDTSTRVKKGCKGDAAVLQPTFMATVPLILDRIFKTVHDTVNDHGGSFTSAFFEFAYHYKLRHLQNGYQTPILDRLVFQKLRDMLGGRLRLMVTGSAPLSPETHNFVRVCISCPLLQAYGLTETCACATGMAVDDLSVGRIGQPMKSCQIMLRDWEEGNYRATDKPYPRGEIIIGGDSVCVDYYKMNSKSEDFLEQDGMRWFCSGDIGEVHEDGCFKIIDRKKDLVKLQFGEYVSLGKAEAALKTLNVIDNICIYGDSSKDFVIALVVPNHRALQMLATEMGKDGSISELIDDPEINKAVEKRITTHGIQCKLQRFEIPRRCKLVQEVWMPNDGLVTAAYKLKRKNIQQFYQPVIDSLYS